MGQSILKTKKSSVIVCTLLIFLTLTTANLGRAQAQEQTKEPIKVMLLGTVHLDNPGRDAINPKVPNVLTEQKQNELREVRQRLADFQPNKVALEVEMKHQADFDSLYQQFHAGKLDSFSTGDFVSKRSEQYQIGFKLAKKRGLEHVYAVDHQKPMEMGRLMQAAQKHDSDFLEYFSRYKKSNAVQNTDSLLQNGSLIELYQSLNTAERVDKYHEPYVRSSTVTTDSAYVGAEVTTQYYERNLRIYANLMKVAEPGDRIFMMFGAGHQPFLRPLLKDSPRVEFVDPMGYLK